MQTIEAPEEIFVEARDALPQMEAGLLWAMRAWAVGLSRGIEVSAEIHAFFRDIGAPRAALCLDDVMQRLNEGAARMLEVNCVCHPRVSRDEMDLLLAMALHQEGRGHEAQPVLRRLLEPAHAGRMGEALARLVAQLNRAGLRMPRRAAALEAQVRQGNILALAGKAPIQCLH
ncbi:hypothetical protein IAI18_13280 [Acetobacteraceae bacterium H6797]|nr:hypothetical protein [Acetobacteraceae bacterium H6797]